MSAPLRRNEPSVDDYFQGVRDRNLTLLSRALTLIESSSPRHQQLAEELLIRLMPFAGKSIRVGITGVPGAGKSTFIEALGMYLVEQGHQVAVLAVDPSSTITGGSIMGDKTRMNRLSAEPNAFIRPSATAGTLGGVARKTRESILVCEAARFDVVLVETVGVGQSETIVSEMTDCFLALMIPGAGDELQGIKRGLLELVDVIAVNKADGSTKTAALVAAQQYERALQAMVGRNDHQLPRVLTCSALQNEGIAEVWQAIRGHYQLLLDRGELEERRRQQLLKWMWEAVENRLRYAVCSHPQVVAERAHVEAALLAGEIPPEAAARKILEAFGIPDSSPLG